MSFLRSFLNLSPRTRIGVGAAFLTWGATGLFISEKATQRFGLEATEKDREALGAVLPKVTTIDRRG